MKENGIVFKEIDTEEENIEIEMEEDEDEDIENETDLEEESLGDEMEDNEDSFSEEDFEAEDPNSLGCVRVINDVDFDFESSDNLIESGGTLYALIMTPTRELAVQVIYIYF